MSNIYIDNGVVHVVMLNAVSMDIEQAKMLVKKCTEICKGKEYPNFFDLSKMKYMSKEAREYIHRHISTHVTAAAFFANSLNSKAFTHSFLGVYDMGVPVKLFTKREEALKWLQQFIRNH